ncbi:MAG: DUF6456 domain-containing protein [Pseudomonadota bacterium]|nr:DUF6456 domain-containing protein [Pseudomonadota bacterium]
MTEPARWERCLARPGARLLAVTGQVGRWAVYPQGDRRRRPLVRLCAEELRPALSDGRLQCVGESYIQTEAGRMAVKRVSGGYRAQHQSLQLCNVIERNGAFRGVQHNGRESPVGRWSHFLGVEQINAAEQFIADYHRSTLMPSVTRNWNLDAQIRVPGRGGGAEGGALGRMEATQRIMRVFDRLGRRDGEIVTAALIREESLAALGRRYARNPRDGRRVVTGALDRLVAVTSRPRRSGCA